MPPGQWGLEAVDWKTGTNAFHWTTGSNRDNTLFSGTNLDQQGRVIHTTAFGIVRYDPARAAGKAGKTGKGT